MTKCLQSDDMDRRAHQHPRSISPSWLTVWYIELYAKGQNKANARRRLRELEDYLRENPPRLRLDAKAQSESAYLLQVCLAFSLNAVRFLGGTR
jgi:hypothetical protein